MKHILLPTDFSDNAWNAIFTARKLFSRQACHFIILNCYAPKLKNVSGFKSSLRSGRVVDGLKQASEQGLSDVVSELEKHTTAHNHTFSTIATKVDLVSQIEILVPEFDLDLIVMGAKGSTASRDIFMGSNTVAVIKKIRNCPVLSVPENFNYQSLKKIIFPTDYTHFYTKGVLRILLEMVQHSNSELRVVHFGREFNLTASQIANKKVILQRLESTNCVLEQVEISSGLSKAITKYAEDNRADMICLVHYEHTFLERLTQEPAVKKVAFNAKIPLLVMPE